MRQLRNGREGAPHGPILRLDRPVTLAPPRRGALIAATLAAAVPGIAHATDFDHEFWPELQVFWRLDPGTQLLFNPAPTRSRDSDSRTAVDWGLYVDYRAPKDPASYRIGYVYSVSDPQGDRQIEHRIVLDFNYRWKLGEAWQLIDRTRVDLRDKEGSTSQRLRNRVQVEYETTLGGYGFVPYSNLEAYYDTRFDAVARWKFEFGATVVFSPQVELTPYWGRQTDTKPQRTNVSALGLLLALRY